MHGLGHVSVPSARIANSSTHLRTQAMPVAAVAFAGLQIHRPQQEDATAVSIVASAVDAEVTVGGAAAELVTDAGCGADLEERGDQLDGSRLMN